MKLMPKGDYYSWYCEWCDSRNLTLWTRFEEGNVFCTACRKRVPIQLRSMDHQRVSTIL